MVEHSPKFSQAGKKATISAADVLLSCCPYDGGRVLTGRLLGKEVVVQTVISCVQPEDGHLTCSYGSVCDLSKRELGL